MTTQYYDLFFEGQVSVGHSTDDVKVALKSLFNANDSYVDALFSGQRVTIKRQVDKATAVKYQKAFAQAGANLRVKANNGDGLQTTESIGSKESTKKAATQTTASVAIPPETALLQSVHQPDLKPPTAIPDWEICPPGADILEHDAERQQPSAVDTSGLSLAAPGADLLDSADKPSVPEIDTRSLRLIDR